MRLLVAALLLLFAVPALAQVPADLATTYMDETDLRSDVETISGQILQQIQGQASQFPEPAREPFREIYGEALSPEALSARLQSFLVAQGDADSLRAVLAWMEQPLVEQMTAMEDASEDDPNAQVALQMYAMTGNFASTPVSPEREAQMDRFLAVTGASEDAVDLYLDIIVASSHSMAALAAEGEGPPPADTIRARMRPQLESAIGGMVRGGTHYAFREASDEDFDAYIEQLETPAAQYASRLNAAAMSDALVGAITDAGSRFAQTLLDLDAAGEIDLDELRSQDDEEQPMEEPIEEPTDDGEMDDMMEDGEGEMDEMMEDEGAEDEMMDDGSDG